MKTDDYLGHSAFLKKSESHSISKTCNFKYGLNGTSLMCDLPSFFYSNLWSTFKIVIYHN